MNWIEDVVVKGSAMLFKQVEDLIRGTDIPWETHMPIVIAEVSIKTDLSGVTVKTQLELEECKIEDRPAGKFSILVRSHSEHKQTTELVVLANVGQEK